MNEGNIDDDLNLRGCLGDGVPVRRKNKGQNPRTISKQTAWVSILVLFLASYDTWVNCSTPPSLSLLNCDKEKAAVLYLRHWGCDDDMIHADGALGTKPGPGGSVLYCSLTLKLTSLSLFPFCFLSCPFFWETFIEFYSFSF